MKKTAINILLFLYGAYHLAVATVGPFHPLVQLPIHIGSGVILAFILYPTIKGRGAKLSWLDAVAILAVVASTAYFIGNRLRIMNNPAQSFGWDILVSTIYLVLILEAGRRVIGIVIPMLVVVLILYGMFGNVFPGLFQHRGMSFRLIQENLFVTIEGVWGSLPAIMSRTVAIFIIFGALTTSCGLGKVLIDLVLLIAGKASGGAAKVAVLASALFGTINGAAVANVAVTGSMTIPMMKRGGFPPEVAGAIEAVAGTGGQIMPPVMGAGAFIMSNFTGISYTKIIIYAAIPAVLYFIGVYLYVHFHGLKHNLKGLPPSEIPKAREVFADRRTWLFFVVVGILLYMLLVGGYSPERSGVASVAGMVVLYLLSEPSPSGIKKHFLEIIQGLTDAGRQMIMLALLGAAAQLIITLVVITPLASAFSALLLSMVHGVPVLALVMVALFLLVMGMGVPTTAAYVIGVTFALPIMQSFHFPVMATHLFIFYYAIISVITPPVCGAVFVAAGIAQANWVRVAGNAVRMAVAAYLVPFVFVYDPALLLMGGTVIDVVLVTLWTALALICLAAAGVGFLRVRNQPLETAMLVVGAIALVVPSLLSRLLGLGILCCVYMMQTYRLRHPPLQEIARGSS